MGQVAGIFLYLVLVITDVGDLVKPSPGGAQLAVVSEPGPEQLCTAGGHPTGRAVRPLSLVISTQKGLSLFSRFTALLGGLIFPFHNDYSYLFTYSAFLKGSHGA